MYKAKKRQGFTIVELVIVIAVIGILTAVLVPTFVNLAKQAQETSDRSFAKNANTALAMGGRNHHTMAEAVADVKKEGGISIDDFHSASGDHLVWDSVADRFAVVGNGGVNDVKYADNGSLKATKDVELFKAYDLFDFEHDTQKFSIYATDKWDFSHIAIGTDEHPLTVGFDVGENDQFVSGVYKRASTAEAQDVIVNTGNCTALDFVVNSPKDNLRHYGDSDRITIDAIASSSYHEFGSATKPVVISQGHIVLESGSDIVATVQAGATATKAAGTASSVEYEGHTPSSVSGYRLPSFVMDYLARTNPAKLDSIQDIQTTPNPDRSTYYRNDEEPRGAAGGADIYKVGNVNTFDFPLYAISINATTLEETVYKNPSGTTPTIAKVSGAGTAADVVWANGTLDATAATAGDKFSITIGTASLEFEIVDGYNVENVMDLSLFSNTSSIYDVDGNYLGKYDMWKNKKIAYFGEDYADLHPNAIILQGDLKIKNTDLPDEAFWSAEQVDQYLRNNPSILSRYTAARNKNRAELKLDQLTEAEVKRVLYRSLKDDIGIFHRVTGRYVWTPNTHGYLDKDHTTIESLRATYGDLGDSWNPNFAVEGNYFKIDCSDLKQVAFFGTKEQKVTTESEPMPDLNPEGYALLECSHTSLFSMNGAGGYADNPFVAARGDGGQVDFKNMTVVCNGARDNDTRFQGGLIAFKLDCVDAAFERINVTKAMISFMSQIGFYKQNSHSTSMSIDRTKSFDTYTDMVHVNGTLHNTLTNSCIMDAGGPLFFLDERGRYLEVYESQGEYGQGDYCGFVGEAPTLVAENVYLENYISGQEPFFTSKPKELVGPLMSQLKGDAYDWIDQLGGKTITKNTEDALFINLIALDMDAQGLNELGSPDLDYQLHYQAAPTGSVTINNSTDVTKNANFDMQSPIIDLFRPNYGKDGGVCYANTLNACATTLGNENPTGKYLGLSPYAPYRDSLTADPALASANYLSSYIIQTLPLPDDSYLNLPDLTFGVLFGMK